MTAIYLSREESARVRAEVEAIYHEYEQIDLDPAVHITATAAAERWGCSYMTALRRLRKMVKEGRLRILRNVRYPNEHTGCAFVPVAPPEPGSPGPAETNGAGASAPAGY